MHISKSILIALSLVLTLLVACDDKGSAKPAASGSSTPARAEKGKASSAPAANASSGSTGGGGW